MTLQYATIFHLAPMCLASQRTHMGPTWNPCVFAICIAHVAPLECATIFHVVTMCLLKDPHGTHMCLPSVWPMWANMWLSLWGHTWAPTDGAHWSMQQFSTWDPLCFASQSTHMGPTYNRCEFTSCVAHHRWSKWSAQRECNGKVSSREIIGDHNGQPSGSAMVRSQPGRTLVITMVSPAGVQW